MMPLGLYVMLGAAYAGILAAVGITVATIWRRTTARIRSERARAGVVDLVGRKL